MRFTTPPSGIGTSVTDSAGAAEAEVTAEDDDADDAGASFEPFDFEQATKHEKNMTPASHIRAFIVCI
jgi:hypothetical protein